MCEYERIMNKNKFIDTGYMIGMGIINKYKTKNIENIISKLSIKVFVADSFNIDYNNKIVYLQVWDYLEFNYYNIMLRYILNKYEYNNIENYKSMLHGFTQSFIDNGDRLGRYKNICNKGEYYESTRNIL